MKTPGRNEDFSFSQVLAQRSRVGPQDGGAFALTVLERMWGEQSSRLPPPKEQMELRENSTSSLRNGHRPPSSSPRAQGTAKARGDEIRAPQRHMQTRKSKAH